MEILNTIWVWIISILGGLSISSIISAVIYGCLKGAFNKTISKINVEKIADLATDKGVERVKKVSFTHNIQPIVESELKKINEYSIEVFNKKMETISKQYEMIVQILIKFSAYFDNSIGVPDSAKEDLKKVLLEALENEPKQAESIVIDEIVENTSQQAENAQKSTKSSTKIER